MSTPYGDRVKVGAYYTDGTNLWEVVDTCALGSIDLRQSVTGAPRTMGDDAFRRVMWLVSSGGPDTNEGT